LKPCFRFKLAALHKGGWGLAFVVYPTALALFGPGTSQFFAVCFWLVLIMLGIDSVFAYIEAAITMICDRFPWWGDRLVHSIKTLLTARLLSDNSLDSKL
jgi:SNF family Na+-dependent transporter